jgi:pimeloyl-ACP methyl ester carboxylesterase
VILNAGVLHRVGPNRINVRLARELAGAGFASLRFDFSGLGDSRPRQDARPYTEIVVEEVGQAMSALGSLRGTQSFLLLGMCSGADNAVRVAARDVRVKGAVLVEAYSVPVPGYVLYAYRRKLLSPASWKRLLRGRSEIGSGLLARLRRSRPVSAESAPAEPLLEPFPADVELVPPRDAFVAEVRGLLQRDVRLCFVYSLESPAYFTYLTALRPKLKPFLRSGQARLFTFGRTDHVFSPRSVQDEVVAAVRGWAAQVTTTS